MRSTFAFALVAAASLASSAPTLYGIAKTPLGGASFVSIDSLTGRAARQFDFAIPFGYESYYLAYNPDNGRFYSTLFDGAQSRGLMELDPVRRTASMLVPNLGYMEGIEYLPGVGLVVAASSGPTATTQLARVGVDGTVLGTGTLPLVDADELAIDPTTGDLLAYDTNNPTEGFFLNRVVDPFGIPLRVGLATDAPDQANDWDLAAHNGALYLSHGTDLVRFDNGYATRTSVGSFGLEGLTVTGIASAEPVPEPATLFAFAAGGLLLRRRR